TRAAARTRAAAGTLADSAPGTLTGAAAGASGALAVRIRLALRVLIDRADGPVLAIEYAIERIRRGGWQHAGESFEHDTVAFQLEAKASVARHVVPCESERVVDDVAICIKCGLHGGPVALTGRSRRLVEARLQARQIRVYATARLAWKRERFDPKARVVERTAGAAGGERPSGKGQKPEKRGHEREGRASPAPAGKTAQEAASWTGAGITSSSGRHDGTAGLLDRGGGWIELGVPVGHQGGGQQCVLGLSVAVLVIDRHLRLLVSITGFRFRSPGSIANCLRSAVVARNCRSR